MSVASRRVRTGIRFGVGAIVGVAAAAVVAAGVIVPWPEVSGTAPVVEVVPRPGPVTAACTGPLLALGRTAEAAAAISLAADGDLVAGTTAGAVPAVEDLVNVDVPGVTVPILTAVPDGRDRADVAGATSFAITDPDLTGFAVTACRAPQAESWIVGGDTATGISGVVLLTNPGDVPSSVAVTVYGTGGPVPAGGGAIIVPARAQRAVSLAGLAGGETSPIIHVLASGTPVQASLQSSVQRTLVAAGVDVQGAAAMPSATQVIPGVSVTASDGVASASSTTSVRVLAPRGDAHVTVTALRDGVPQSPIGLTLQAGVPGAVDLSDLPAGSYDVFVSSDVPVVAAAQQLTGFGAGDDIAWYTSAPPLRAPAPFAVPAGPSPTLHVVNPTGAPTTVLVGVVGGGMQDVVVQAHGSATVPLQSGAVWVLDSQGTTVHAAVSYTGADQIAGYPVQPGSTEAETVVIHP